MSRDDVILLDGSMGHELKARGLTESFSTAMLANITHADLVTSIHAEYCAAGCTVLTTNTFTLTPHEMEKAGRLAEMPSLLHAACDCARRAASTSGPGSQPVLVAGSLPPLRHCYLPELVGNEAEMRTLYDSLVRELAPRVDMFLAETLCSSVEARAALQAAAPTGKPCWLSFTLHDDAAGAPTLRGGEAVPAALAALEGVPPPAALLYNCCAPSIVTTALAASSTLPAGVARLGGYANGFRSTTSQWLCERGAANLGCAPERHRFAACPTCAGEYDASDSITPVAYAAHAERWVERGASIVGGCCGIGPTHLKAVSERLRTLQLDLRDSR